MIDHNVMRFHIAVHDALTVAVVKSLEKLRDVVADVEIVELGVEAPKICVVDVLENQRRRLTLQFLAVRNGALIRGLGIARRRVVECEAGNEAEWLGV